MLFVGCENTDYDDPFEEEDPKTLLEEERATVINETGTDIVVSSKAIDDESVGQGLADILNWVFFDDPTGEKETEAFVLAIPAGETRSIRIVISPDRRTQTIRFRNTTHSGSATAKDGAILTITPEMLNTPLPPPDA